MARFKAVQFTPQMDSVVREMRGQFKRWQDIGDALGMSRAPVIKRARELGIGHLVFGGTGQKPLLALLPLRIEPDIRDPMPPGDPVSWGLLTDGTVLAGIPYVYLAPNIRNEP